MEWQRGKPKQSKMKDEGNFILHCRALSASQCKKKIWIDRLKETCGNFQEAKKLTIWSFFRDRKQSMLYGCINGPRALRIPEVRAADLLRLSVLVSQSEVELQHIDKLVAE